MEEDPEGSGYRGLEDALCGDSDRGRQRHLPRDSPGPPEVATIGADRANALERAASAIETGLGALVALRRDIPQPSTTGDLYVEVPALSAAKVELYRAMRADGVTKAALARRLGVAMPQVDRLVDLRHHSRMDAIERAFAALGRRLDVVVERVAA